MNFIIKILSVFIPSSKYRKIFRNKYLKKTRKTNSCCNFLNSDMAYINMKIELENYKKNNMINLVLTEGIGDTINVIQNSHHLKSLYSSDIFYFIRPSHEILMKMYGVPPENYMTSVILKISNIQFAV